MMRHIVHYLHLTIFSTEKVYKHEIVYVGKFVETCRKFYFIPVLQCFNHPMTACFNDKPSIHVYRK